MDTHKFRSLSAQHRALVAVAVLIDGHEAPIYLENDAVHGQALMRSAEDLSALDLELRMAYVGSMLRDALEEL